MIPGLGFGIQTKLLVGLAVVLVALFFLYRHEVYQQGVKDQAMRHVAQAAERSIKAERTATSATVASEREVSKGKLEVADLRRRHAAAVKEAKAARQEAAHAKKYPDCPAVITKGPETCPPDTPLVQP